MASWPECRQAASCNDTVPFPDNRVNGSLANLANSTSVVTEEFQLAEYKCETAGWVLPDGSDTFSVQVGMSRLRHLD